MCDIPFLPIFPICFQCGTDQNPCRCKVVGPTLGMFSHSFNLFMIYADEGRVYLYGGRGCTYTTYNRKYPSLPMASTDGLQVICYPASIFCGCCLTQTGKEYVFFFPIFFTLLPVLLRWTVMY